MFLYSIILLLSFVLVNAAAIVGEIQSLRLPRTPPQFRFYLGSRSSNVWLELLLAVEDNARNGNKSKRLCELKAEHIQWWIETSLCFQPTKHHEFNLRVQITLTWNPSRSGTTRSSFFLGSERNRALLVNRPSLVPPFPL